MRKFRQGADVFLSSRFFRSLEMKYYFLITRITETQLCISVDLLSISALAWLQSVSPSQLRPSPLWLMLPKLFNFFARTELMQEFKWRHWPLSDDFRSSPHFFISWTSIKRSHLRGISMGTGCLLCLVGAELSIRHTHYSHIRNVPDTLETFHFFCRKDIKMAQVLSLCLRHHRPKTM